jgi:hypothetical protein
MTLSLPDSWDVPSSDIGKSSIMFLPCKKNLPLVSSHFTRMSALFNQVSLALKPYPITKFVYIWDDSKNSRVSFDFLVPIRKIIIDVHTKSFTVRDPDIKHNEERSAYKKQLAIKYKYTYIEIRSPEDIAEKLLPYLVPTEDSR